MRRVALVGSLLVALTSVVVGQSGPFGADAKPSHASQATQAEADSKGSVPLGVTPDHLWSGIHKGCGAWAPCMYTGFGHIAEDDICRAKGNCLVTRGAQICAGTVCIDRGTMLSPDHPGEAHVVLGEHGMSVAYWLQNGTVTVVKAVTKATDETAFGSVSWRGVSLMARVASAAVPEWEDFPMWAGKSFYELASFGLASAEHSQRYRNDLLKGMSPEQAMEEAGAVPKDDWGEYLSACERPSAECQRVISGHGFRATMKRSVGEIMELSIEAD